MNLIEKITEHFQIKYLNNFEKTKYGKYMKSIHNTHMGESCFIIGNGPSLTVDDLDVLKEKDIDSFAANRIYLIFDKTLWRPTYFVNTDPVMIKDVLSEVNAIEVKDKFIPLQNKFFQNTPVKGAHYFYLNGDRSKDPEEGFSLDCTSAVNELSTVTIASIQLAIHMGYRYIYLIGVDHNFDNIILDDGKKVVIDNSVKNHFIEGYDDDVSSEVVHNIGVTTRGYMKIEKFAKSHSINIYNASRQTKLDVFERVDFESAVLSIVDRNKLK